MAEKRTRGALKLRLSRGEVRAVYAASQIPPPYTVLLRCVVAEPDLMVIDTAPKRGHALPLFAVSDIGSGEHTFWVLR